MNYKKTYIEAITTWRPLHSSQDFSLPVSQNAAGILTSPAQPCSLHSPLRNKNLRTSSMMLSKGPAQPTEKQTLLQYPHNYDREMTLRQQVSNVPISAIKKQWLHQ